MSKETFTGQKCHRESCASTPCWQGIPLSCWSKIIGLISLKAKWQWSSPQFADIYAITRPLSIPLTTTETCMATMKIQQDHDSQHTTCSELLRKPVWKLQACCSIPRFMALRFSLDLFFNEWAKSSEWNWNYLENMEIIKDFPPCCFLDTQTLNI